MDLATGGTAVDLSVLNTDVSPEYTDTYKLGSITKQWKAVHTAGWADTGPASLNGLWAGSSQIKGKTDSELRYIIDLPVGSTVDDQLIIDPDKTFFKTINVNNDQVIEATTFGSNVNFDQGLGITLSVDSSAETIEFAVDPTFDLNGSIIADDLTTVLVDRAGYLTGNVEVANNWTITVNSNVWTYETTGQLEFPGGATFGNVPSVGDVLTSGATKDLVVSTEENFKVITDSAASAAEWVFSSTGELTVPGPIKLEFGGNPIFEFSTTTIAGRVVGEAGKSFDISLTDGIGGVPLWSFGPSGSLTFPSLATFSDIAGDDVFAAGPARDLKLVTDTEVSITTDAGGSGPTWTFASGGDLTTPGDIQVNSSITTLVNNALNLNNGGTVRLLTYNANNIELVVDQDNTNLIWTFNTDGDIIPPAGGEFVGTTRGLHIGDIDGNIDGDLKGSVFGDDSSILVDGTGSRIVGPVYTSTLRTSETKIALGDLAGSVNQGLRGVAIGFQAGENNQGDRAIAIGQAAGTNGQGANGIAIGETAASISQGTAAIAIGQYAGLSNQGSTAIAAGYNAGNTTQGTGAIALGYVAAQITQGQAGVAIGWGAAQTNQGDYAIAIGYRAGFVNQHASSIVLNGSGALLNTTGTGFYVNPIRSSSSSAKALMYDTATSELFYSTTLEFIGSTISTSDSSGLTVDVLTTFNSDVVVENDVRIRGSKVLNLAELKEVVAASTDFADFQARIAAL